jgi:hypothetical protein
MRFDRVDKTSTDSHAGHVTIAAAKRAIRKATDDNVTVSGDVTSFGGWSKDEVVSFLRGASTVKGDGPSFVVDGTLTVVLSGGLIFVLGARHR